MSVEELCVPDPAERLGKDPIGDEYVQPSLFMHLLKSLMPGQDLTRVLIPVFFLESRSLLEKFTDLLMHVDLLEDPKLLTGTDEEKFLIITKFFMSGWHYKTVGAKKPYNPIIGETFACEVRGKKHTFQYIAEQVIHHPPVSAFYVECTELDFHANGQIWTKSKFLGNSVKSILEGTVKICVGKDTYLLTLPTFVATGLFLGSLRTQICDKSTIKCVNTGIEATITWHTKPMMWGDYNCVDIEISKAKKELYKIAGKWDSQFTITRTGGTTVPFLDVRSLSVLPKYCLQEKYQGPYESRRLWEIVTNAIRAPTGPQWDVVEKEKTRLEEEQRLLPIHLEGSEHHDWDRKLFHLQKDEDISEEVWIFNDSLRPDYKPKRSLLILSRDANASDVRVKDFVKTEDLLASMHSATA